MNAELILAVGIAAYLRKNLQTKSQFPQWDRILRYIIFGALALLIVSVSFSQSDIYLHWAGHALSLYLIYILYAEEIFRKARSLLFAIAPFILLSFLKDVSELIAIDKFKVWKGLLDTAIVFSFIWMFVMWAITSKQRKALENERLKTKHEEEQKKMMESMNNQLEVQVAARTAELTRQKEELQNTLDELKSAQAQLIQSEKMASLGQLTAGIAHEIQNPLNFVNNFSDLNKEMLEELKSERLKAAPERDEGLENELITDVINNSEKIAYHGRRADNIVKSMLQHSRTSSGTKMPTDINVLCDEYLRLSFHGMRAKDKTFNSGMQTDFDAAITKINIVPQDVGRVLLNLITNAFYEVNEKRKITPQEDYQPMVKVKTAKKGSSVEIEVMDNGRGIPDGLKEKIFQPFFTTKPTGEGTGLGLSLSYDIVKANGGTLSVDSVAGQYTTFKIILPLT